MTRNGTHRRNCRCPQCTRRGSDGQHGRNWTLLGYKASTILLLGLVVALLLVGAAIVGGAVGYKLGLDDGYGYQATSSIGFHVTPNASQFPTYVYRTGNLSIGGYTFVLGTDRLPELSGTTTDYAPPGGPIYIETDRRLVDVYESCVHEKLHRTHPGAPHRWIYDVQSPVVDDTCLKLIHKIG